MTTTFPAAFGKRMGWGALWISIALLAAYLLTCHFVQNYSDPVGFVFRAEAWGQGPDIASRAPAYPMILHYLMKAMGRDWIFISNLPFVLLWTGLLAAVAFVVSRESGERKGGLSRGLLGAVLAAAFLVHARSALLLTLVNPFREPMAYCCMLVATGAWLIGWSRRSAGWFLAGGLALGFAASLRETSFLMVLPAGLWLAAESLAERKIRWGSLLLLGAGLAIGLLPLFCRNYQHSGSAVIPSYAAEKVEKLAEERHWDIPVPGMSIHNFRPVGATTWHKLGQDYGVVGAAAFVFGLLAAARNRRRDLLFLFFPAFLLYVLFYSCYWYYKDRYVSVADLFAIPIAAYGVVQFAGWLERRLARWLGSLASWVRPALVTAAVAGVAWTLTPWILHPPVRTKVWHLAAIRGQILPHIRQPAWFMGGRHFCYQMAWLLEQDYYEYALFFNSSDTPEVGPLGERLRVQGEKTVQEFAEGNYYLDDPIFPLGRNWLDLPLVFNFDDLTVPFERYGRPVEGGLFRADLWSATNVVLDIRRDPSRSALLMLDMRGLWDYPGRTFAAGREEGADLAHALTNAVQFIELPPRPGGDSGAFRIDSDRPLPRDPFWRIAQLNDSLRISFGMADDHWAWNLASSSLFPNIEVPTDCCRLYDRGEVLLPAFADSDHDVCAEFRMEFIQESSFWRQEPHRIVARTPSDEAGMRLPPRRTADKMAVKLARGTGRLERVPVMLESTLPSYSVQVSSEFAAKMDRHGFVKLYDVGVFSIPRIPVWPVRIDLGGERDGLYLVEGFHRAEKAGSKTARWTEARAVVRARLPKDGTPGVIVRWNTLPGRPGYEQVQPTFRVGEAAILPGGYEIRRGADGLAYEFEIPADVLGDGEWTRLEVETTTFSPAREWQSPDARELGLFVESVEIQPL